MDVVTIKQGSADYPAELTNLKRPPAALYCLGTSLPDLMQRRRVAVVGSRAISPYGKQVTRDIVRHLAQQGIVIISGLAYGVDAEAHRAAIEVGGTTVAILPSPVQTVAPTGHQRLAQAIVKQGGALISSYPEGRPNHKMQFVERNEYMAALSEAVIITEAAEHSGSLHTAHFALDLHAQVFAVPGNVTSKTSAGTNHLLATGQAKAITSAHDVLIELGIGQQLTLQATRGDTPAEQAILDGLMQGISDGQQLLEMSGLAISDYNQALTMLEIAAKIRPLGGNHWGLA